MDYDGKQFEKETGFKDNPNKDYFGEKYSHEYVKWLKARLEEKDKEIKELKKQNNYLSTSLDMMDEDDNYYMHRSFALEKEIEKLKKENDDNEMIAEAEK